MHQSLATRWYEEEDTEAVASTLIAVASHIRDAQSWRTEAYQIHAMLYAGGGAASGLNPGQRAGYEYVMSQIPHNIVRQCINAMTARVCKSRPLPIVQASAGSWRDYTRARKASQFLEGEEYRQRFFAKTFPAWVRDAEVFGSGFLCVRRHRKAVITERVLPTELFVDEWDAQHGDPRNLYRVRDIDRGVAMSLFATKDNGKRDKEIEEKLMVAARMINDNDLDDGLGSTVDRITLVEAWHLCDDLDMHAPTTSPEDKKAHEKHCTGRYVVACSTATLTDLPWTRGYFPFPKLDYEQPIAGYYGQGLAEQLEGYQFELNKGEDRIQEGMDLAPGLILLTDGDVLDSHLTNGYGRIVKGQKGAQFQPVNVQPVHEQFFQRQDSLMEHAYRESGQTTFGVAGEKPKGIDSGAGLREIEDQETGRHVVFARAAEEAVKEVARQWIDCVKEIAEEYGDAAVSVPMNDGLLELKWSDCDLERFELRVFSASVLPQQRAARMQTLKELFDAQLIDRSTFLQQLEASDLQGMTDLETAGRVLVDEQLEAMLFSESPDDEDEYLPPSQFADPKWAKKRAQQKAMWGQLRKAPPANLNLMSRFIADCDQLMAEANSAAAPPPNAGPPAGPMPVPSPPGGPVPGPPMGPALPSPGVPPMLPQVLPGAA